MHLRYNLIYRKQKINEYFCFSQKLAHRDLTIAQWENNWKKKCPENQKLCQKIDFPEGHLSRFFKTK